AAAGVAVSVEARRIRERVVSARADRAKSISYGELVAGQQFNMTLSATAPRTPASAWTVLGQPVPRLDMAAMVAGQFEYVHNVRVPDMLHGRVVRPPAVGATLRAVDETSVRDVPGVVKVVIRNNFVGFVAARQWHA